ncbi:MAG: hypothetical protein IAF94_23400 [Pirellulaceae bacterium]|nr:hypothetical protein [Pirellulaceae bacterium]
MAEAFDPYYIWLGIPPEEQPADYYRLLGIRRFENNEEVIANAADQRVRHLRSVQAGKRQAETQRLLNEISSASGTLLDPDRRKEYDAKLRGAEAARHPTAKPTLAVTTPPAAISASMAPRASNVPSSQRVPRKSSQLSPALIAIGAISAVLVVVAVAGLSLALLGNRKASDTAGPVHPNQATQSDKSKPSLPTPPQIPKPSPLTPTVNPSPPQVIPQPPAMSPVSTPPANPEHQNNWEYGYGRVDGSGRVLDFRPLVYSVMTEPDGTKSVLWGTELVYSDTSPMSWMCLRRDGGVSGFDPQIVVVRRWRCPELAYVAVKGEVQHASMQGDGIRAYLVTGTGRKIWSAEVMNTKAAISAEEFLLPPHETLDFYVDCKGNQAFDHFNSHLVLDVRYTRRGREPRTDRWDSITDYRDPPQPASGSSQVQEESGEATARFVRIELPGKAKVLQLAEVQVYSGSVNVAVRGNATQSSTDYDGSAKLANDGNTNGQYPDSKSVSHTRLEDNPWWEVDLGAEKVLDKIVVWNRTDGGTEPRLLGYKVLALDASRKVIWQVSPPEYPKPRSEFALSRVSRGIPGGAETVRLGKPVDILKESRPKMWASAEMKDGQLVTAVREGALAMMVFDYVPRGEYLLDMGVTRTTGVDGILIGLTVDGRPFTVSLDCFVEEGRGGLTGLELVDGKRLPAPDHPALHRGKVLKTGQRSQIQVAVRKGHVAVQVDGRMLIDWKGDASRFSRTPITLSAAGDRLGIGTWKSTCMIDSLKVYPILGNGIDVATVNPGTLPDFRTPKSPEPKSPLPREAALATAKGQVQETFADSLAKSKKPSEKLALAKELLSVAESEKDRAVRYALLDLARNLATAGQDVVTAVSVAESMAGQYEIDESQLKLETLKLAGATTLPASAREDAVGAAMALAGSGRDRGQTEVAEAASLLAVEFAAKVKNLELRKQAAHVREVVLVYRKSAALVKEAEATLTMNPDDPAANLAVGKWRCFVRDDWANGLPCLEKCGESGLSAAARAEKDPQNSLAIADAWHAAAADLSGQDRLAAWTRSHESYARAGKVLRGLDQLRAKKRQDEVHELLKSQEKTTRAKAGRGKLAADEKVEPGLLVRLCNAESNAPLNVLLVVKDRTDLFEQAYSKQAQQAVVGVAANYSFVGMGYIELEKDDTVKCRLLNADCTIDGMKFPQLNADLPYHILYAAGEKRENFTITLRKGRHRFLVSRLVPGQPGPEFTVTTTSGENCLVHSTADREAELARPVRIASGGTITGVLIDGRRDPNE